MIINRLGVWCAWLCALAVFLPATAAAQDAPGSGEHPLVPLRFPDAVITDYEETAYDAIILPTEGFAEEERYGDRLDLEGRITEIVYRIPAERSTIEVFRAYADGLDALGFQRLYACAADTCGGRGFNLTLAGDQYMTFGDLPNDQRYLAARLDRPEGTAYAMLFLVKAYSRGGADQDAVFARLTVIETDQVAAALQPVAAEEMRDEIGSEGAIALYGLLFDFDSADLLPASRPTLDEMARLLAETPDLSLFVVGHTDSAGALDYNLDLSRRRAAAVVDALVTTYGVDPARLEPHGLAFLAPVASNATEDGRALNRRVELVAR